MLTNSALNAANTTPRLPFRPRRFAAEDQVKDAQAGQDGSPDYPEDQELAAGARIEWLHALRPRSGARWS